MICKHCKREIPNESEFCQFCGEKQVYREKKWQCPECGFLNKANTSDCMNCNSVKPTNPVYFEANEVYEKELKQKIVKSDKGIAIAVKAARIIAAFQAIVFMLVLFDSLINDVVSPIVLFFYLMFAMLLFHFSIHKTGVSTYIAVGIECVLIAMALSMEVGLLFFAVIPIVELSIIFMGWKNLRAGRDK